MANSLIDPKKEKIEKDGLTKTIKKVRRAFFIVLFIFLAFLALYTYEVIGIRNRRPVYQGLSPEETLTVLEEKIFPKVAEYAPKKGEMSLKETFTDSNSRAEIYSDGEHPYSFVYRGAINNIWDEYHMVMEGESYYLFCEDKKKAISEEEAKTYLTQPFDDYETHCQDDILRQIEMLKRCAKEKCFRSFGGYSNDNDGYLRFSIFGYSHEEENYDFHVTYRSYRLAEWEIRKGDIPLGYSFDIL
ncbi:MAG: hypothetical protein J6328_01300 [Bacilli bacterium]|nr:hypothetical protein [Bacilli bacterium]